MKAIGFEQVTDFVSIMNKIQNVKEEDLKKLRLYFEDLRVDSSLLHSKTCPRVEDIIKILKDSNCDSRVQILVYLCVQDTVDFSYVASSLSDSYHIIHVTTYAHTHTHTRQISRYS